MGARSTETEEPATHPPDDRGTRSSGGGRTSPATIALLVTGMACFGSATPVSAIAGRHLPVWLASFLRMAVAAAVLVPVAVVVERRREGPVLGALRRLDRGDWARLVAMAAIGTFGFSALMLLGMRQVPGAVGAVVMATTPAVTAIGAVVFLRDRLRGAQVLALVLAVGGVVVVEVGGDGLADGSGSLLVGSALVFLAVCCEATYSLVGKRLTADLSPLVVSTAAAVLAVVLFAPLAAWDLLAGNGTSPDTGEWVAVAWWGVGTFALGSLLWFRGMSRAAPAQAAAFMAVMPVSALVLSYVLLDESFAWIQAVGMALVLLGLVAVARSGSTVH